MLIRSEGAVCKQCHKCSFVPEAWLPIVIEVMGKKMDSQLYVDTNIVKTQILNFFIFLISFLCDNTVVWRWCPLFFGTDSHILCNKIGAITVKFIKSYTTLDILNWTHHLNKKCDQHAFMTWLHENCVSKQPCPRLTIALPDAQNEY